MTNPHPTPSPSPGPKPYSRVDEAFSNRWIAIGNHSKPDIPTKDTTKVDKTEYVKISEINNYISNYLDVQSDISIEQQLAFNSLTGNEILTIARNYNVSTNSQVLNKNILDITTIANSFSPTEIIKFQNFDGSYFAQFSKNLSNTAFYLNKTTGTVSINIPKSSVSKDNFIQIQVMIPKSINNGTIY